MRTLALLTIVIISSLHAAELPFKPPAAYACDVAFSDGGKQVTGRLFLGGPDKQRMEMKTDEGAMVVIVRQDTKQMHMLMSEMKMVMTMPYDPKQVKVKDPTQDPSATWKKTGNEKVNGVDCDRYEWSSGKEHGTAWIDAKQSLLVRVVGKDKNQADFTNYRIGAQKADLFEVPPGYKAMNMGGMGAAE